MGGVGYIQNGRSGPPDPPPSPQPYLPSLLTASPPFNINFSHEPDDGYGYSVYQCMSTSPLGYTLEINPDLIDLGGGRLGRKFAALYPGVASPTTPLERLYDTVLERSDSSSEYPAVVPKLRSKAYLSAKALLHLAVQRKCIDEESNTSVLQSIAGRRRTIGSGTHEGDSDLESTLGMIDHVFTGSALKPMRWEQFSFTASHHSWHKTGFSHEPQPHLPPSGTPSYTAPERRVSTVIKNAVGHDPGTRDHNYEDPPLYERPGTDLRSSTTSTSLGGDGSDGGSSVTYVGFAPGTVAYMPSLVRHPSCFLPFHPCQLITPPGRKEQSL